MTLFEIGCIGEIQAKSKDKSPDGQRRLEVKSKLPDEPKHDTVQPETPRQPVDLDKGEIHDAAMEEVVVEDDVNHEEIPDVGDAAMKDDTTECLREVDEAMHDHEGDAADTEMVAMMDVLQTLGFMLKMPIDFVQRPLEQPRSQSLRLSLRPMTLEAL